MHYKVASKRERERETSIENTLGNAFASWRALETEERKKGLLRLENFSRKGGIPFLEGGTRFSYSLVAQDMIIITGRRRRKGIGGKCA